VVAIIQPHADQLGRPWNRREKLDGRKLEDAIGSRMFNEALDIRAALRPAPEHRNHIGKACRGEADNPIAHKNARFGTRARALKGYEPH
jgi:hypothetical protein